MFNIHKYLNYNNKYYIDIYMINEINQLIYY